MINATKEPTAFPAAHRCWPLGSDHGTIGLLAGNVLNPRSSSDNVDGPPDVSHARLFAKPGDWICGGCVESERNRSETRTVAFRPWPDVLGRRLRHLSARTVDTPMDTSCD
jgi:hypothetical protein